VQEGEIEPVGARKSVKIDVRLISATNRNLIADVKAGRFREDLFYRLHVFPIAVPPLRERAEDIPDLVRHFLVRFCAEEGKSIRMVAGEALALLGRYRWPGNVRQLENAVFRAVVLADDDSIGVDEFPQIAAQVDELRSGDVVRPAEAAPALLNDAPGMIVEPETGPAHVTGPTGGLSHLDAEGHVRPLDEIEAELIRFAIAHYRGQMSEVARRLRIGRSTLYRKLESLGLAEVDGKSGQDSVAAE
jgi:DNA-binding NtrC family response regulator